LLLKKVSSEARSIAAFAFAFAFQKDTSEASAIAFDFAFDSLFNLLKSF
jgi:phosphoheptose isomerase